MHSKNETIVYFFNKMFYDLVNEIKNIEKSIYEENFLNLKVKNLDNPKNIKYFCQELELKEYEDITKNLSEDQNIFDNESFKKIKLTKNMTFSTLVENVSNDHIDTLKCYFYNLLLISYIFSIANNNSDENSGDEDGTDEVGKDDISVLFENVIGILRKIQNNEDYAEVLENIYDPIISYIILKIDKFNKLSKTNFNKTRLPDIDDINSIPNILENSVIGGLAKDISKEINMDELNIEKPEDIMKLMSGNVIGKVGEKIQKKLASGEINQADLLSEAMNILGSMNKGGSLFNNSMFKDILSGTMGNMGNMKNMGNMGKVGKVDKNKIKKLETISRLQEKVKDNKKL